MSLTSIQSALIPYDMIKLGWGLMIFDFWYSKFWSSKMKKVPGQNSLYPTILRLYPTVLSVASPIHVTSCFFPFHWCIPHSCCCLCALLAPEIKNHILFINPHLPAIAHSYRQLGVFRKSYAVRNTIDWLIDWFYIGKLSNKFSSW